MLASGEVKGIHYGAAGDLFQWTPFLFVSGAGSAADPQAVTQATGVLTFSFGHSFDNANLLKLRYEVHNPGGSGDFNQLRFMLFANPDGDPVSLLDQVGETWGAALAGDPARREARAFGGESIIDHITGNANLTDGPPTADCLAAAGCDATLGLQWNAATLKPGESFVVTLGVSDDGQHLSQRTLTATGVGGAGNALTLSGTGLVVAVPEAPSWMLSMAGLASIGLLIGRRRGGRA